MSSFFLRFYSVVSLIVLLWIIFPESANTASYTENSNGQRTYAPNKRGISLTRHNFTFSYNPTGTMAIGWWNMNDYGEVCVCCHTPHGANRTGNASALPLWNRTNPSSTYTVYQSNTMDTTPGQPDGPSMACLSCHDGTIAIDSIVNMPNMSNGPEYNDCCAWYNYYGPSGNYSEAQKTSQNEAFLDSWVGTFTDYDHLGFSSPADTGCLTCHGAGGLFGGSYPKYRFDVAVMGTELRDDHPISLTFPTSAEDPKFNQPTKDNGKLKWWDVNGDNHPDDNEVRLYNGKVQCASCHNPHGTLIPGDPEQSLYPNFLRATNANSALCMTCHIK